MSTLDNWFEQFLATLREGGWLSVFTPHGWDLTANTSRTKLAVQRDVQGFDEFASAGECAIEPGDPALSLLYHGLMHPGIHSPAIHYWPSLEEIDTLENYIYAAAYSSLSATGAQELLSSLVPVVMTYEYRVTQRTPHQQHADMVFSRTGVGRVGTHAPEYIRQRRCFNTAPNDDSGGTRVQPARYGVFLCRRETANSDIAIQGAKHSNDERRDFYMPVCKLFDGMSLAGNTLRLAFRHYHQSDKLQRMVERGKLVVNDRFDLRRPPFFYRSDRDNFVDCSASAGNVVVWRQPQTLCRPAEQDGTIACFKVPKESLLWLKKLLDKLKCNTFYNNRRYTSLRVGQFPFLAAVDYALNALLEKLGSDKRVFLSPRQAGEFTNIRHVLDGDGKILDLNLLSIGQFKSKLSKGGYDAVMYEDPLAEGFVSADIQGLGFNSNPVKAAYSLMTAPDYMPRVGNIYIYQHKKNFVIGGPRALCEGRLPVNLRLTDPATGNPVFTRKENTVTAITARPRKQPSPSQGQMDYDSTHFMTDEASDVFAPGWDVTYTRDSLFSQPYYHTSGLGSPFLEDVKLCAAANGMWPAASPDAARTFKRTTRTALPLTDEELGLAPGCALRLHTCPDATKINASESTPPKHEIYGWDGEYGPYIEARDNLYVVNYASIERSDYLSNYANKQMDFAQLRKISRPEANQRMASLAHVNQLLLGETPLKDSPFWLVSFVCVPPKADGVNDRVKFINLPDELIKKTGLQHAFQDEPQGGYFYIFAKYSQPTYATEDHKRRIQPVDSLHFVAVPHGKEPRITEWHP